MDRVRHAVYSSKAHDKVNAQVFCEGLEEKLAKAYGERVKKEAMVGEPMELLRMLSQTRTGDSM
jgi:hypothetical protein